MRQIISIDSFFVIVHSLSIFLFVLLFSLTTVRFCSSGSCRSVSVVAHLSLIFSSDRWTSHLILSDQFFASLLITTPSFPSHSHLILATHTSSLCLFFLFILYNKINIVLLTSSFVLSLIISSLSSPRFPSRQSGRSVSVCVFTCGFRISIRTGIRCAGTVLPVRSIRRKSRPPDQTNPSQLVEKLGN